MDKKPYLGVKYFTFADQWSSRIINPRLVPGGTRAEIFPVELSFGTVSVGSSSNQQTAQIKNSGLQPLPIKSISAVGDYLVETNAPLEGFLDIGESAEIKVSFVPRRSGIATGGIYIDTGDAAGQEFINLVGYGTGGSSVAGLTSDVSSLSFGSVAVGSVSAAKVATLTNEGSEDITVTAATITGQFELTVTLPVTLAPGDTLKLSVVFKPTTSGSKTGAIALTHNGTGVTSLGVSGTATGGGGLPIIYIQDGILEALSDNASVTASATSLSFSEVVVGSTGTGSITLLNTGGKDATILTCATDGTGFALASDSAKAGTKIPAGGSALVKVTMTPAAVGSLAGLLSITTDTATGSNFTVSLSGSGVSSVTPLARLAVSGVKIINSVTNAQVRLKSVNWFGMESTNYIPHGTWTGARKWKDIIDQIASMGFNCIRFPFSGDTTSTGRTPPSTAIDADLNPDLVGLSSLAILDLYINYCTQKGIYVVLDHHRRSAGDGADGSPVDSSYTMSNWKASWAVMANRYGSNTTVIGADVHNEPHDLTWSVWAGYVEECANSIHAIAPNWLIFVEGVGTNSDGTTTWWGGALKDVATRPIVLTRTGQVVYSPHEYGQSVGSQSWLSTDSSQVSGYPANLDAVWDANWGFIHKNGIAPIWIGEFGGKFGVDGSGNATQPNGTYEKQWLARLISYLNSTTPMNFAYWCFNPNSSDTGGLVKDDWVSPQTAKLNLLANLLT